MLQSYWHHFPSPWLVVLTGIVWYVVLPGKETNWPWFTFTISTSPWYGSVTSSPLSSSLNSVQLKLQPTFYRQHGKWSNLEKSRVKYHSSYYYAFEEWTSEPDVILTLIPRKLYHEMNVGQRIIMDNTCGVILGVN